MRDPDLTEWLEQSGHTAQEFREEAADEPERDDLWSEEEQQEREGLRWERL